MDIVSPKHSNISCEYIHILYRYYIQTTKLRTAHSVQEVTVPVFSCFSTNDLEEEDPGLTSSVLSYWVALR